jgi:hypothetical protein
MPTRSTNDARNLQRSYLCQAAPLGVGFDSDVADFREMVIGSVQAWWSGNDTTSGEIELWASNVRDPAMFARIDGSLRNLDSPRNAWVWNLGVIGYRYLMMVYTPHTTTTGVLTAFATGKISR